MTGVHRGINALLAQLSPREAEVARLLVHDVETAEIAARLKIAPTTAAIHVGNARKKLGCATTNGLVAKLAAAFIVERAETLFDAIAHGDDEHRFWLRRSIADHFAGRPVEPSPAAKKIFAKSELSETPMVPIKVLGQVQ